MPLKEQLINAIRNSDNIKVSNLLDRMDVSAVNHGITALHTASQLRSDRALTLLAKPGIDVNVQSSFGSTPLHNACEWASNDQSVWKLLAKPGIDVNVQNSFVSTPLHFACRANNDQAVTRLLATPGINVNLRAYSGWTPVMAATGRNSVKTFKLLLHDPRVDLDIKDNEGRGLEEAVGLWVGIKNDTKYDLIKEERMKRGNVQPARPATPHPTLASNSRKRSRVESDDDNDNLSPFKVQGVDRLDASKQCVTPVKFRGKTAEEIEEMGDNDKLEYTLHMSMKSVPATTNNNIEDQNLAAAIKASLIDTPAKRTLDMENHKIFSDSPTTAAANKFDNMDVSGDDTVKMEAPKTQAEEERQFKEALQLSLLGDEMDYVDQKENDDSTSSFVSADDKSNSFTTAPSSPREIGESSNNNQVPPDNNNDVDDVLGLPEHDYRLVSVVSHYGATTSSGHYVADVYRFDQGSWFRYDDTVVTPINELNVRNNGNNTKNGYIFMYVQEALAQQYDTHKKSS